MTATGNLDITIDGLAHDSRAVEPGSCFVAIAGGQADGHLFIDKAVQHGATAVVCTSPPETPPGGVALMSSQTRGRPSPRWRASSSITPAASSNSSG